MLHTDFVSNFCLFFKRGFRLATHRQKRPCAIPAAANGGRQGPVRLLLLTEMERRAEPAPRSVTTVHRPERLFLTQKVIALPRSVASGFWYFASSSCIRKALVFCACDFPGWVVDQLGQYLRRAPQPGMPIRWRRRNGWLARWRRGRPELA